MLNFEFVMHVVLQPEAPAAAVEDLEDEIETEPSLPEAKAKPRGRPRGTARTAPVLRSPAKGKSVPSGPGPSR